MFGMAKVSRRFRQSGQRGLTLLEVSLAMVVLTTSIMGVYSLFITSEMMQVLAREESLAMYASKGVINQLRVAPFENSAFVEGTSPEEERPVFAYHNYRKKVDLAGPVAPNQRLGAISIAGGDGRKVDEELGVILIYQESPNESDFGDVDGDGDLDFPIDLNGNGSYSDVLSTPDPAKHPFPLNLGGDKSVLTEDFGSSLSFLRFIPVVVVVRWRSLSGLERRVQLVTYLTDRLGGCKACLLSASPLADRAAIPCSRSSSRRRSWCSWFRWPSRSARTRRAPSPNA
ncbi:MAG: prepilin-type N-terminal cleavage/methylation domain-containing protein [Planctomycetota bacterium]|nr:prepilin-type N-terminal cleavage/methylation domain-containing protein [Planctomycetota bacterium]